MFKNASRATQPKVEKQGHLTRIVGVYAMGKQPQSDYKTHEERPSKYEVMITLEFPEIRNDKGQPIWLSMRYRFPLMWPEKSGFKDNTNIYKLFNTFVPDALTQSKKFPAYWFLDDSAWEKLLGLPCYAETGETNTGKPKLVSLNKVPVFGGKTIEVPPLENPAMLFDASEGTLEEWKAIFPWVRDIILQAEDDETREAAEALQKDLDKEHEEIKAKMSEGPDESQDASEQVPGGPDTEEEGFDDDVPF